MGGNLPPGVTPADIDKHFGAPERKAVDGEVTVTVTVSAERGYHTSDVLDRMRAAVDPGSHPNEIVHAEIIEIPRFEDANGELWVNGDVRVFASVDVQRGCPEDEVRQLLAAEPSIDPDVDGDVVEVDITNEAPL